MAEALRSIALTVEKTEPGAFVWVLLERGLEREPLKPGAVRRNDASAMAAGLLALQEMVDDLDAGPREAKAESRAVKGDAFGFGFGGLK